MTDHARIGVTVQAQQAEASGERDERDRDQGETDKVELAAGELIRLFDAEPDDEEAGDDEQCRHEQHDPEGQRVDQLAAE